MKKLDLNDVERKEHLKKLNDARMKRYYEKHKLITFGAKIDAERYYYVSNKLKEEGITIKEFIERAIDRFLSKY